MAAVLVPSTAEIVLGFACPVSGYSGVNVLHAQFTGPALTAGDVSSLANNYAIAWEDTLKSLMATDCELVSVQAKDISVAFGAATFVSPGSAGAFTGNALPQGCGSIAKLQTDFTGRPFRGRMFHYGTPAAAQDATNPNALDSTYQGLLQTAMTNFISAVAGMVLSHGISNLGVTTSKSAHVAPETNLVTGSLVELFLAYQRRRAQR